MGVILFVAYYRIHLLKDFGEFVLAGRIQLKFLNTLLALLVHINSKDILPVTDKKRIC